MAFIGKQEAGHFGMKRKILAVLFTLMLVMSFTLVMLGPMATPVHAAARTASVSGNWSNTATWGGNPVPVAGDTVTINSGISVTVDTAAVCTSLTFTASSANSNVTISGSNSLTISGALTITRPGSNNITNTVAVGAGTLSAGSIDLAGTNFGTRYTALTISTGTVTVTGNITSAGSRSQLTFTGAGTLNAGGTFMSGTRGTFTAGTGTVNFNAAGAQSIAPFAYTFNNVTLSGSGAKTLTNATINGNLTLSGAATATTSSAMTVGGNLVVGDGTTFTAADYNLTVTGTTTVGGGTTGNLTISSATGTKRFTGLVTVNAGGIWNNSGNGAINFRGGITNSGTFTAGTGVQTFNTNSQALNGTLSIPRVTVTGVTLTNNGTLTVTTALAGSGGLTNAATGTLNINFTGALGITTLTATASGNTVNYGYAGNQTVKATTYSNLTLSGSGVKTFPTGTTTVNGILSMEGTATATVTGTLTYGAAATLQYKGSGAQTTGTEFPATWSGSGGVIIANTSGNAVTLNAAKVVNAPLTINSGATLNTSAANNYAVTFGGNFTNSGGTFTANASAITISGTGTQSIAGFTTAGTVSMTKTGGTATFTGNVNGGALTINGTGGTLDLGTGLTHTFTGAWTRTNGSLLGNSSTLNIGGSVSGTGGTFTAGSGTVNYNGSTQAIANVTYNNLTINQSSGDATLGGNATVNGTLTLTSGNLAVTDPYELTLGDLATTSTTATTDVTGIVTRTPLRTAVSYTFGNQYTVVTFNAGATLPNPFKVKTTLSAPSWKTGAVLRTYDIIQTGGSGTATVNLHYLDGAGLNGNTENKLVLWDGPTPVAEHGRSNHNMTDNWVGISGIQISYFPTAFDSLAWTLGDTVLSDFTWNGSLSTDWSTAANWYPAGNPLEDDDVIIPDASTTLNDPILPASVSVGRMTIQSGGILNATLGSTITVTGASGAWSSESGGIFNHNSDTVIFTNAAATADGVTDFYNVTIDTGAGLTMGTSGTMRIGGTMTNNGIWPAAGLTNTTIEYNGGSQTVLSPNGVTPGYDNLILSGSGTKTMPGTALSIGGDFSMSGTASATAGAAIDTAGSFTVGSGTSFTTGAFTHTIGGDFSNSGIFTATGSTITLNGTSAQAIGGTTTTEFNNLTINNANGVTLNSSPTISGTLTLTSGTFAVGANTLTLNGPTIAGTPANMSTTSSSSLVFGGSSSGVNIPSSVAALNNLTINNANGVTLNSSPTISGTLTLTSGTFAVGANTLTLNGPTIAGTPDNMSTTSSSSLVFGGSSSGVNIPSSVAALNNLTINNANGVTLNSSSTISGTLTLTSGTFAVGANTLTLNGPTIAGTPANMSTTSSSSLVFGGSSSGVNIPSSVAALNNLTIDNANGVTLNSSPTISGTLTLTSGNLAVTDPYELTLGDLATTSTTATTDVTGIVTRTPLRTAVSYTFGNQYTVVTFNAGATLPNPFKVKTTLSAPSWKTGAVLRTYDIIQTGGSGTLTLSLHYLDGAGLNGNTENKLVLWDGPTPVAEHGRSNHNMTDNWVGISGIQISYFPTAFDSLAWTLGDTVLSDFTWNGSLSTDWSTAANWTPEGQPLEDDDVIIPDASTTLNDPILPASVSVGRMTIQSGGILNATLGSTITVTGASGAWSSESGGIFNHNSDTVVFTNAAATADGVTDFYNVTIDTGAGLTMGTSGTMRIGGTMTNNGIWRAAGLSGSTVEYNGGDQTVLSPNGATPGYDNLILSGTGTKTAGAAINILDNFTVESGTSFTTGAFTHTIGGDFSNSGTFTAAGSTITLNGTSAQAIGGTTTTAFNNLTISNTNAAVSANTNFSVGGTLTVDSSAVLNPAAAVVISGGGTLTGNGTVNVTRTEATADFSSQYTISNKTLTNLTAAYVGSAAQTVSALTYGGLKINNANGVTLGGDATVNGTLTLTSGNIATNDNTVIMGTSGSVSGGSSSSYVYGNLQKYVATGAQSPTFEVGTASNYNPVTVDFGSVSVAGNLTASVTAGEQPNIATSIINSSKDVNAYWTLTNSGITFNNYSATFNFNPSDIDSGADTDSFIVGKYDWLYLDISRRRHKRVYIYPGNRHNLLQ